MVGARGARVGIVIALVAVLAIGACGGDDDDAPAGDGGADTGTPATSADLEAGTWTLVSYVDSAADGLTAASDEGDASARFDGSTVAGSTGCNNFNATYELSDDGALSIGPAAVTKKLCSDSLNQQEQAVLAAIEATERAVIADADTLQFLNGDGDVVLIWRSGTT